MRGRIWLIAGVVLGVVIAAGRLPYLAGAAESLAETGLRLVGTGGNELLRAAAKSGAPGRAVAAAAALIGILVPGVTALILVVAARSAQRLRQVLVVLLLLLAGAAYAYLPGGEATGVLALAAIASAAAFVATGPIVVVPLVALATLIGSEFLSRLTTSPGLLPGRPVETLNRAILSHQGSPLWLRVVVLAISAVPFAFALRLLARGAR